MGRRQWPKPLQRKINARRQNGKKKKKKAKWLSEEAVQITVKSREVKGKGERELYTRVSEKSKDR